MKLLVFAVHDRVVEAFGSPFTAQTEAEAQRMFLGAASDPSTYLAKNPADFSLYQVGTFNNAGGELSGIAPVRFICGLDETVNQVREIRHGS
jgi:hypothetical protein